MGSRSVSHLTTLAKRFGKNWDGARRFGVVQGGDNRPIDDYSGHGHKTTSGTVESMNPAGIDEIAGLVRSMLPTRSQDKEVGGRRAEKS